MNKYYLKDIIWPRHQNETAYNAEVIINLKKPRYTTKWRSFLGLCNIFRRFITNFSCISVPLSRKFQKSYPKEYDSLDDEMLTSMKTLQWKLISPPIPAWQYTGEPLRLCTDAWNVQVCCVLLQDQLDLTKGPNGYRSRSLTNANQDHNTTQLDCLAIVSSVLLLSP